MKLVLIRHLESMANITRCYSGWSDVDLSPDGYKKGKELEEVYKKLDLNGYEFFCSSLSRARKTMELLFPNQKYTALDGLKETNFGIFEMKTYPELKDTKEFQEWANENFVNNAPKNGESYVMMMERVLNTFKELLKLNKNLVIVTHGGPTGVIMRYLLNDNSENIFAFDCPNGDGYIIDLETKEYKKILG